MKPSKLVPLFLGLALLVGCGRARIRYDSDARVNYSTYKVFDWALAQKNAGDKPDTLKNTLMEKRVKQAVEKELGVKGFILAPGKEPDFLVNYYPTYQDRSIQTFTHLGWGRRCWGMGTTTSEVHTYQEGTIVIEMSDAKTKQLIWQGAAEGALTGLNTPEDAEEVVNREVKRLLENFPPKP